MGKEKSTYSSKNNRGSRKSLLCAEERPNKSKKTMKSIKNQTKESADKFDLGLLKHLSYTKERNKLNDIDENIKVLKTQLMSLYSDKKTDKTYDCSSSTMTDSDSSDLQNSHSFKKLEPLVLGSDLVQSKEKCEDFNCFKNNKKNFKPVFVSTPAKFSEQMKEKTYTKIFIDNEEQNAENLLLKIKSQEMFQKSAANSQLNKFDVSLLSQQKIEELLYKSFIMQNSKLNFSLHDKTDSGLKKSTTKIRKEKFHKFKKQSKDHNSKFNQQNLNKYYRSTQRGKKRRRTDTNSSLSEVEVINLDSSSCNNIKSKNSTICIDLDVEDYDWNEPFDLNNTEFPSEPEIIESCEKKEAVETQELKFNNTDVLQSELSYCNDEKDKTHLKKVWECPVCFEQSKGQEVVATQCGHIFCKKCLETHFSKFGKSCPSCRTNLKKKPFITLFNF